MPHILVVDDDPSVRRALTLVLERSGFSVDEADGGRDALRNVSQGSYDAAIVDYQMPPPDGLEILTQLRDLQPRCVRILMSGALDLPLVVNAVSRGEISRVVQKPFSRQDILDALSESIAARTRMEDLCIGARTEAFEIQRMQLEECLADETLSLALQPIVDARKGTVRGYEALLRSTHPTLDTPLRVIAAAETHGMLGRVADRVALCATGWLTTLPEHVDLFVNLHPAELSDVEHVRRWMENLRPWSHRVVLEITERSHVLQMGGWRGALDHLTDAGFRIAVDDVGAGYNSLSVLAELRPAFMKVDMSIVRNIEQDDRRQRLLELLSRFARATNTQLIVEGIETEAEASVVRRIGTDLMQGFLFGRPARSAGS
jgi:EAL domain-containing protein (putative c-di-GMP-specific phosphodiesterase class I)/CheY-like chemotaxis protein